MTVSDSGSSSRPSTSAESMDVLIIGAGLSGICAAYHLQDRCPELSFSIVEARDKLGGTWDLFRYPGIRSDSDMYTLGFSFKPWANPKAIADGPSILAYLEETAREHGIDRRIRYGQKVVSMSWSSDTARWSVTIDERGTGQQRTIEARFIFTCAGYYRYDRGHEPAFDGLDEYGGLLVHPQHWPEDLDYEGKRVVVIGSGATAVTLAPALSDKAASVTMLQRSPSYVLSMPSEDRLVHALHRWLPETTAHRAARWKNALFGIASYRASRRFPKAAAKWLVKQVARRLGDGYDVDKHFTPRYDPWDQRLCLVPDGDLFRAIKKGHVDVVTDEIERFTPSGIALKSAEHLEADIVVTATGLELQFMGGADIDVDGSRIEPKQTMTYKGMMLSDVPNLMFVAGYTNASWTLKADLVCVYACRLLEHMRKAKWDYCIPDRQDDVGEEPIIDFSSGYILRASDRLPRGGDRAPWRLYQNYVLDTLALRRGSVEDGIMRFARLSSDASAR